MYRYLSLLIGFLTLSLSLNAQNDCQYQIIVNDAGEDGWGNASISFIIEENPQTITLTGATDTILIDLVDGDSISLIYVNSGGNNLDNNFQLLDSDGQVLVNISNPPNGVQYEGFVSCPTCPAIDLLSVVNVDSFDTSVLIDWEPSDSLGVYQISYAPCNFLNNPDSVELAQSAFSEVELTGLRQNTCYEFQISLVCQGGEESIASGPHKINTIWTKDVGISGAFAPQFGQKCDFLEMDTLFVFLKNFGAAPQTLVPFDFELFYNLEYQAGNVAMPDDGLYTGILSKDSCVAFPFEQLIDISKPGDYTIIMRTILSGDSNPDNDEFTYTFSHTALLPFFEQFTDSSLPERWTADEEDPFFTFNGNEAVSSILGPLNSRFVLTTHRYGRLLEVDSLSFKYAFIAADPAGTAPMLTLGDQLIVEISTDCGESYSELSRIDMDDVNPNTGQALTDVSVSLKDYIGESVNFKFTTLRGGSTFRIVLDDINVYSCGQGTTLNVERNITNATSNMSDGAITVLPTGGVSPYTFMWSNSIMETGESSTISNLPPGIYTVTISDALNNPDCTIISDYEVKATVATTDLVDILDLNLYPNPAQDVINLDIELAQPLDINVSIYNALGQRMWNTPLVNTQSHRMPISVSSFKTGLYFLQISTPRGQVTRRFVVEW